MKHSTMKKSAMKKTMIAIVIVLVAIMSACTSSKNTSEPETSDTPSVATPAATSVATPAAASTPSVPNFDEKIKISIAFWDINNYFKDPANDPFLKYVSDKFNVEIEPRTVTWSDWKDKNKLWTASGDLPDVWVDYAAPNDPIYKSWIENKSVRPLPDDMSPYPGLESIMKLPETASLKAADGKFYLLPRTAYSDPKMNADDWNILIRKDWQEKLNIPDPQNFDDFIAMMQAFATKDPDGNGKNDTMGLEIVNDWHFTTMLSMFTDNPQADPSSSWVKEDGQWKQQFATKAFAQTVANMQKLFQAGGVDKDFAVLKPEENVDRFAQGKAGAINLAAAVDVSTTKDSLYNKFKAYNPDKDFLKVVKVMNMWPDSTSKQIHYFAGGTLSGETYFNAKTVDDKKMDRILRIMDYFSTTGKGFNEARNGIEGTDFKMDGDKIVTMLPKDANGNYPVLNTKYPSVDFFSYLSTWGADNMYKHSTMSDVGDGAAITDWKIANLKNQMDNFQPIPYLDSFVLNAISTPSRAKVDGKINVQDSVIKIMMTKGDPVEQWNKVVKQIDALGYQDVIKEMTAEAAKLGK